MHPLKLGLVLFAATAASRGLPARLRRRAGNLVSRQDGPVDPDTHPLCTHFATPIFSNENCASLADWWGISVEEFIAWNPSVQDDCSGFQIGNSYCVEVNNGEPIPSGTQPPSTPTPTPRPSPVLEGIAEDCTEYYFAVRGDVCDTIAQRHGISTSQFFEWNPVVGADCSGLWAEYWYCVAAPGSGSPTSSGTGVPSGTGTPRPSPVLDGIAEDCEEYYFAVRGDICDTIAQRHGISTSQFFEWNPAVGSDCAGLWAEYWYCVAVPGSGSPTSSSGTGVPSATGTPRPSPVLDGIAEDCEDYYFVVRGDICDTITQQHGISLAQFVEWNPAVGSDCSGLWAEYWYCVAVPGSSNPTPTSPSTPPTTGPTPPTLTQPGIVANCQDWHPAVAGDTCQPIVDRYGLTLAQFVQWNPAVGSDCSGLWAGYSYCVGTPEQPATTRTTTTTSQPAPTGCQSAHPTPTQPGAICNCTRWHLVQTGDNCWELFQRYNINEAQFNRWNVGVNCNIWLNAYVCVGGP